MYVYIRYIFHKPFRKGEKGKRENVGLPAVCQRCQQGPLSPPFAGKSSYRSAAAGSWGAAAVGARAAIAARGASSERGLGRGGGALGCALPRPGWGLDRGRPFRIRSGPGEGPWPAATGQSSAALFNAQISALSPELVRASPARSRGPHVGPMMSLGFSAWRLHPGRVAEAPSSFSAADLHANCVWEKFFNWQD